MSTFVTYRARYAPSATHPHLPWLVEAHRPGLHLKSRAASTQIHAWLTGAGLSARQRAALVPVDGRPFDLTAVTARARRLGANLAALDGLPWVAERATEAA